MASGGIAHLRNALDSFRCYLDKDIEEFLREKALSFLDRKFCSVYLIVDEQAFDAGHIQIDAYFTLSHKSLIPCAASKSSVQKTSGFKDSQSIHFVLIGQLGKYLDQDEAGHVTAAPLSSAEILDNAFEVIQDADALIPCCCALVECSENEKVHQVYLDYGFHFFQFDGTHHQFYKRI